MAFGRTVLPNSTIFPTRVSADGSPKYKAGGITIDWGAVTASGSDVTLPDGSIVKANLKFLRYGQVVCKETTGQTQTLTGTATSGAFTLNVVRPDNGQTVTTGTIAFNASAATVLTAIQAVLAPGQAVSSSGGALGTAPVVVTFGTTVALMTVNAGTLAGGTVTNAATTNTGTTGMFGPYDPSASDGRQNLNRGDFFILDETVLQYPAGSTMLTAAQDHYGSAIEGGDVFIDRVLQSGTATHTLALGPTLAEVTTAFPRVSYVRD
jgi:hypothetical protein